MTANTPLLSGIIYIVEQVTHAVFIQQSLSSSYLNYNCEMVTRSFDDFYCPLIAGTEYDCMMFCQNRGVISQQRSCTSCAEDMTWKDTNTNTYADRYMWNCRGCRISQSVRNNSILSNSRLSFKDFIKLLASWANYLIELKLLN